MTTCWVVERHDIHPEGNAPFGYLSWDPTQEDGSLCMWTGYWERALKFCDRASAEMMCVEMPFEWDVKIMEHQVG